MEKGKKRTEQLYEGFNEGTKKQWTVKEQEKKERKIKRKKNHEGTKEKKWGKVNENLKRQNDRKQRIITCEFKWSACDWKKNPNEKKKKKDINKKKRLEIPISSTDNIIPVNPLMPTGIKKETSTWRIWLSWLSG